MLPSAHTVRVDRDHRIELVLPDLPEGATVSVTVDLISPPHDLSFRRQHGSAVGQGRMTPNFEDPLEEFEGDKY